MQRTVADRAGRQIELRSVGVLETLRLYKALGPTLSQNEAYIGLATVAAAVSAIDNVPLPFPANEAAVEAALERLGDDGADAVAEALRPEAPEATLATAGN